MINATGSRLSGIGDILTGMEIEFYNVTAPLHPECVWEIESLLLKIFEYGNYSFRSALSGEYSETLNCTFFLAKHRGFLIGTTGCLCSQKNPAVAIIGPVGVAEKYRSKGIGTKLVTSAIEYLRQNKCIAAYLGVSETNPAVRLYAALGFKKYKGIVRRLLLKQNQEFEKNYFGLTNNTNIRRVAWGDYPGVLALIAYPGSMYTIDFRRSFFSSRYVEPSRFLSVFPEMMSTFTMHGGFANVLVSGHKENVVGLTQVRMLPGDAQRHIAELDFYVHDNFIGHAKALLSKTVQEVKDLPIHKVNCYCLGCDAMKQSMIKAFGGVHIATCRGSVWINSSFEDVLIYEIKSQI